MSWTEVNADTSLSLMNQGMRSPMSTSFAIAKAAIDSAYFDMISIVDKSATVVAIAKLVSIGERIPCYELNSSPIVASFFHIIKASYIL